MAKNQGKKARGNGAMMTASVDVSAASSGDAEIQARLEAVLKDYNDNRVPLLTKALQEGGPSQMAALEDEYQALQAAQYDLIRRALDRSNAQYAQLKQDAVAIADAIKSDIKKLQNIAQVVTAMATLVSVIGRLLIITGL